jgi:hypothetical protein
VTDTNAPPGAMSNPSFQSLLMSQPISIRERLEELGYVNANGSGWCPRHEQSGEHGPSFAVTVGPDGRDLAHCYAGCDQRELFEFILCGIREDSLPVCTATEPPACGGRWGKSYGRRVSVWTVHNQETYGAWCWYSSLDDVPHETELYVYRDENGSPEPYS